MECAGCGHVRYLSRDEVMGLPATDRAFRCPVCEVDREAERDAMRLRAKRKPHHKPLPRAWAWVRDLVRAVGGEGVTPELVKERLHRGWELPQAVVIEAGGRRRPCEFRKGVVSNEED